MNRSDEMNRQVVENYYSRLHTSATSSLPQPCPSHLFCIDISDTSQSLSSARELSTFFFFSVFLWSSIVIRYYEVDFLTVFFFALIYSRYKLNYILPYSGHRICQCDSQCILEIILKQRLWKLLSLLSWHAERKLNKEQAV